MTRGEFAKPYLVALYKQHRIDQERRPSIADLIKEYQLPRDEYLENELYEYLGLNGWAKDPHLSTEMIDGRLFISGNGKIVAESYIEEGVNPVRRDEKSTAHDYPVPASDRIVTLTDNQINAVEAPIADLLQALQDDNGDPDVPGLRVQALGQIKAGRELIRAGEYKAYLLYEVLFRALSELIRRYQNPTISALANALLGAVVSTLLQSS